MDLPKTAPDPHMGSDLHGVEASLPMPRFAALRAIMALVLREMGTTYGRSPGGYAWAILEPLGMILMMTLGFSLLLREPSLGTSFILFYATGYVPLDMYTDISQKTGSALKFSQALLAYPRMAWIDAIIARVILNLLTNVMVAFVLLGGILVITGTQVVMDARPMVESMAMTAVFGTGVGTMNCLLSGKFDLWARVWPIVTRPLFLASGIFYLYEDMPGPVQDILWWNPLIHATALMRKGFYSTYDATFVSLAYGFGFGLVTLAIALLFLGRYYQSIIER